jgi:hypothetical protein
VMFSYAPIIAHITQSEIMLKAYQEHARITAARCEQQRKEEMLRAMKIAASIEVEATLVSEQKLLSPVPCDNGTNHSDAAGEPRLIESESP